MKKIIVLSALSSFFVALLTIFIFNSYVSFFNRPKIEGVKFDDGGFACIKAYDSKGPRDCDEVYKSGEYDFIPVDPSRYHGPRVHTGSVI